MDSEEAVPGVQCQRGQMGRVELSVGVMCCWLVQLRAGGILLPGGEGGQYHGQKACQVQGHSSELGTARMGDRE